MNIKLKNSINWLLPVFLILFILEVIAFPFAVGITYAVRSEDPSHTLTYLGNRLTWSDVKGIDQNGVAELSLFDAEYESVKSDDGSAVIAPGTKGFNIIRLKNVSEGSVDFTAVLFAVKSSELLPVKVTLADGEFSDIGAPSLPNGVLPKQVIRSVSGRVAADGLVDFDISWLWDYEADLDGDMLDVDFGNKSANGKADDITVGFYLVVEDNNVYHTPQTGDRTNVTLYVILMCVSAVIILTLFIFKRKDNALK